MVSVLLLTDRPEFDDAWGAACRGEGLTVRTHGIGAPGSLFAAARGVIIDGGSARSDVHTLLAQTALARVRGAVALVALTARDYATALEDLLLELCGGLLAGPEAEIPAMVRALKRRCERPTQARFAYLGEAPGEPALIGVLSDGRALLLDRPAGTGQADVSRVELKDEDSAARVWLADGGYFDMTAAGAAGAPRSNGATAQAPSPHANGIGDIDGVRLGQRLRALRLAAGLTQAELARRTGIHRPNIARVEAGRHTPSLETLARLAAAIGVSTTRVLTD